MNKKRDITFITGDFNAKLGKGIEVSEIIEDHGLRERNNRGKSLEEFCQQHNMVVTNISFKPMHRNPVGPILLASVGKKSVVISRHVHLLH